MGEFKGKPVNIIISRDANEEIEQLKREVRSELLKGKQKSTNQILLSSIIQKIELLKNNPEYGIHIPKDRIPKEYINRYSVNNLWKINLSGAWRLIYTIRGSEIEIIALVLDIINHKKYDKKFGYRKR